MSSKVLWRKRLVGTSSTKWSLGMTKTTHKVEQLSSLTYKGDKANMHETYDIENYQFMLKLLISKLEYCIV